MVDFLSGSELASSSRFWTYCPRLGVCVLVCLWAIWKTFRPLRESLSRYRSPILFTFYVAINCKLLYTIASSSLLIMDKEREQYLFKSSFSAVENVFTNIAIYLSLERMIFTLRYFTDEASLSEEESITRRRRKIISGLRYTCWVLLCIQVAVQTPLCFFEHGIKNIGRAALTFCNFVYMAVVFVLFTRLLFDAVGVWLLRQEKTITAFFLVMMIGQLEYSLYCVLRVYFSRMRSYDNLAAIVFVYTLTLTVDLLPCVLIVLLLTRESARGDPLVDRGRRKVESGNDWSSTGNEDV